MTDLIALKAAPDAAPLLEKQGLLKFDFGGTELSLSFRPSPGAKLLVISFHGAVDREKRTLPVFPAPLPQLMGHAHQLAVSDPSLRLDENLRVAWFAGDEKFRTLEILSNQFKQIAEALGVRGTIYFGSSAGGFAALNYSWHHPGSLAIVGNPQTRISAYYEPAVAAYLGACWPSRKKIEELPRTVVTDVCALYRQMIPNFVVYLQNSTDEFHLYGHAAPFMAAVAQSGIRNRVTFEGLFTGKLGHSQDWASITSWLRAATIAPNWTMPSLVKIHETLRRSASGLRGEAADSYEDNPNRGAEIQLSNLLRDFDLKRSQVGT